MALILWHNPRCSKSREALSLLQARGEDVILRRYLDDPPTLDELRGLLARLKCPILEMVRTKEAAFKEAGLTKDSSQEDLLTAMAANPKLIERPILITDTKAVIGRPPEKVLDLI